MLVVVVLVLVLVEHVVPYLYNVNFTIINRVPLIKFRRTSPGHQYYKQYATVGAPKSRFLR